MKTLLLIRHAKSSWDDASQADFDRPLNTRGTRDAEAMAKRLAAQVKKIDVFFSSPAKRAKTTARQFVETFKAGKDQLVLEDGLYLAPESFFYSFISGTDNRYNTIAVFAHNPGITEFANSLATAVKTDNIPTCGIFAVTIDTGNWNDFASAGKELLFYDYPKLHS